MLEKCRLTFLHGKTLFCLIVREIVRPKTRIK
nr:MAG TPA: hypothetical protein [Caudoviricetes sp.]